MQSSHSLASSLSWIPCAPMASRLVKWTRKRYTTPRADLSSQLPSFIMSLPDELLLELLKFLEDKSLGLMAAVSKQFYPLATEMLLSRYGLSPSSVAVSITSSADLRALQLAMALRGGGLEAFGYYVPDRKSHVEDIRRIEAMLRRFTVRSLRLTTISMDFGGPLNGRPVGLLSAACGNSAATLLVVNNGLFTCKRPLGLMWSPPTDHGEPYCRIRMHNGSLQRVPCIPTIYTLDIHYPVCMKLAPSRPWTMILVNAEKITTFQLSLEFSTEEWAEILWTIALPNLTTVSITTPRISFETSTAFLNRHFATITTLSNMSAGASPSHSRNTPPESYPDGAPTLSLPKLGSLNTMAHYVVRLFETRLSADLQFPALTHVELWPDEHLLTALRLLAAHASPTHLTLWLSDRQLVPVVPAWPVFTSVDALVLNKIYSKFSGLSMLIAHAFPSLRRLDVNDSFLKQGTPATLARVWSAKQETVSKIAQRNPNINRYFVDGELFEM